MKEDRYFGALGGTLLALSICLLYIVTIPISIKYNATLLPTGDTLRVTTGLFELLDSAHNHYFETLWRVFFGHINKMSLLNFFTVLFSPILVKDLFSLAFINFFLMGLASLSWYRLCRFLNLSVPLSVLMGWIVWIYPANFGFLTHESVPIISLDAAFYAILNVAVANLLIFSLDPTKRGNALLAGLAVGFSFGGRGASFPVVAMVAFPMCLHLVKIHIIGRAMDRRVKKNIIIFSSIAVILCLKYYITHRIEIGTYENAHIDVIQRHSWNLKDALPYIKNVPGFYFWRDDHSYLTILITWMFHFFMVFSLRNVFKKNHIDKDLHFALKLATTSGTFIYFCTLLVNILIFTDPVLNLYNCLLIYMPMRIGMTLNIISFFVLHVHKKKFQIPIWSMMAVSGAMIIYGAVLNRVNQHATNSDIPTPRSVEYMAKSFESVLGNGTIAYLWFYYHNDRILAYYRFKNNLPQLPLLYGNHHYALWTQTDHSEENRLRVRIGVREVFTQANFIIIAEYLDTYHPNFTYAFYKFRDEIALFLNAPGAPKYVIRMVIMEANNRRLFVLQRKNEADGKGVPLPLPYGFKGSQKERLYSGVPVIGY